MNEAKALMREFQNYPYYRKKLDKLKGELKLIESDLYYHITSPLATEYFYKWENGKIVRYSQLKQRGYHTGGNEYLEKERDRCLEKIKSLEGHIKGIERDFRKLDRDTKEIVNVVCVQGKTLSEALGILEKRGIYYSNEGGLYKRMMTGIEKIKDSI